MSAKDTIILFYPEAFNLGKKKARIPYSLLFLERVIRDLNLQIILLDEVVDANWAEVVEQNKGRLLLAGVSSMTGNQIFGGIEFSKCVRSHCDAKIVWGGWHPSLLPEETLDNDYIDFVVVGQGEKAIRELVLALMNDSDISAIGGLAYKTEGGVVVNPKSEFTNPFEFPKIDYTKVDIRKYIFHSRYAKRAIRYFSSLGCPYNCGFCSVAVVYGRKWYHNQVQEIVDDFEYFIKFANIDGVKIDDDNFFVNRSFVIEFCNELIKRNLNLEWYSQGHASHILKVFTAEDILLMYKAGARLISIGAESGDQDVLDLINKKNMVADNIKCSHLFSDNKIDSFYTTMVGFPLDPEKDFKGTLSMLMEAKLIDRKFKAFLSFYTPYPGTDVYEVAVKNGFVPPHTLEQWAKHTLRRSRMPWVDKKYYYLAEYFMNFYLPLANFKVYKEAKPFSRPFVFLLCLIMYPIVNYRFKHNNLKFPIEARLTLGIVNLVNKVFGTRFKFRYNQEGYLN
jgi:radical SAM superfamily enzyme YgiQ (UPF0313 family)